MATLRSQVIKLAETKPELRPFLVPLLAKTASWEWLPPPSWIKSIQPSFSDPHLPIHKTMDGHLPDTIVKVSGNDISLVVKFQGQVIGKGRLDISLENVDGKSVPVYRKSFRSISMDYNWGQQQLNTEDGPFSTQKEAWQHALTVVVSYIWRDFLSAYNELFYQRQEIQKAEHARAVAQGKVDAILKDIKSRF